MANSDNDADFPWLIDINVFMTPKSQTNWSATSVLTNFVNNGAKQTSGAQNAEIAWDVVLGAGTWTVELVHGENINHGIYSVQIDGIEQGTIDAYDSLKANTVSSVANISITESGIHELKLKMATKNPSATLYYGEISHVQLRRTA